MYEWTERSRVPAGGLSVIAALPAWSGWVTGSEAGTSFVPAGPVVPRHFGVAAGFGDETTDPQVFGAGVAAAGPV